MKHRWASMRYIDENGQVTDLVQCVNCGFGCTWTNVDVKSPIPREVKTGADCGERIVKEVMES